MLVTLRCERVNEGSSSSQLLKHFLLFPPPPLWVFIMGILDNLKIISLRKGRGEGVALKKCDGGCRWRGCVEKVSKWLLIDYQILPAEYLLFWCETQWEEDIASKVICVLPRTLSLIISVAMIRRKMLVKKDVCHLVTSVGQRKKFPEESKSKSPWGITPQTFRFRALMLYHWATETPWWVRSITKFIWHASSILLGSAMLLA